MEGCLRVWNMAKNDNTCPQALLGESVYLGFLCSSFFLPPLLFNAFPRFLIPVDLGRRWQFAFGSCAADWEMLRLRPPVLPKCQFGSRGFSERWVLPRCWLQHEASLPHCPWPRGSQRQISPPSTDVRGEEQSDRVCPFTKANLSVVPSVLQLHETQWALWKRQKICSECGEKMDVKIRCWELVGAWIIPEQTKNNKTKNYSRKYKKETCLKMGGNPTLIRFLSCIFPTAFHACVHFFTLILLRRADPNWHLIVQKCCDTAGARNAAPCHAGEGDQSLLADEKCWVALGDAGYPSLALGPLRLLPKGTAVIQSTAVCRFSKARKENCRLCEKW